MGIFKEDGDEDIDKQFASVLQAAEVSLFSEFKKGYKSGLKAKLITSRVRLIDELIEDKQRVNIVERPYDLGYVTGLCVDGIMSKSTYGNDNTTNILCNFITVLERVPGFNKDILKKRAKRIDAKGFLPEEVRRLKIVLRALS